MSSAPKKSSSGKQARSESSTKSAAPATAAGSLPLNRYVTFFAIAIVGCAVDLITKQLIFRWRGLPRPRNEWWLITDHLGIETSLNQGALFGMGAGMWWLFASFSVLALIGIIAWLFFYRAAHDRWLTVALGCVTGGILGNLYDRLGLWDSTGLKPEFQHAVRDWILFKWEGIPIFEPWPNFNIADSLLVTGAIMLVLHAVVWRDSTQSVAAASSSGAR